VRKDHAKLGVDINVIKPETLEVALSSSLEKSS
jgi:hypothetical protein